MLTILLILLLITIYIFRTKKHKYWLNRNVKYEQPTPLLGQFLQFLRLKNVTQSTVDIYNKYPNEKVVGYFVGNRPVLIIRDLDLIRKILNVDFDCFYERGFDKNPVTEPMYANLIFADGDKWKLLRQHFSAAFTMAKLKAMFPLVVSCSERLQHSIGEGGKRDVRELMARFSIDVTGACVFGIEMDAISNERSNFRDLGKLIMKCFSRSRIMLILQSLFPELRNILNINDTIDTTVVESVTAIVKEVRDQRGSKPSGRNDLIDIMLEMEAKGKVISDSIERRNPDGSAIKVEMQMDIKCMVAQVFIFFVAGFETSSLATSFTLHQLAYNPDVQMEVHKEIDEIMLKYDNKLSYEAIADMATLDRTLKEAMRVFPPVGAIARRCVRTYTIPELNLTIEPGVRVFIPVQAIHMDEKYFDNPKEFRPDRFRPEAVRARHNYSYLPFGEGPRSCIGEKLGHMQSLAGLAAVLHRFTVEPAASSKRELDIEVTGNDFVQGIKGGLPLLLKLRKNNS